MPPAPDRSPPSADARSGRTLLSRFDLVATFDDDDTLWPGGDILVDGAVVAAVGVGLDPSDVGRVVDCRGVVALPGLVNAHQHLYQGGFRAVPAL